MDKCRLSENPASYYAILHGLSTKQPARTLWVLFAMAALNRRPRLWPAMVRCGLESGRPAYSPATSSPALPPQSLQMPLFKDWPLILALQSLPEPHFQDWGSDSHRGMQESNDFKQFALRFRGFLVLLMCIRFLRCALGLFWFAIHDQMAKLLTFNAIWLCQIQATSF